MLVPVIKCRNEHLFKKCITKSDYPTLIDELYTAIDAGQNALKVLLLGSSSPDLYAAHGTYSEGQHNHCDGLKGDSFTEKRLCKCLYYRNSPYKKKCETCEFTTDQYNLMGNYKIKDYEIPAFYYGDEIGEIDLVICGENITYATEVKPYKGNSETLLRMVAEIMTYTLGYPEGKYEKAIAFFEGSEQDKEYESISPKLQFLMAKANITVFRFEKCGNKAYKICKL